MALVFYQREGERYFNARTEIRLASEVHRALLPQPLFVIFSDSFLATARDAEEFGLEGVNSLIADTLSRPSEDIFAHLRRPVLEFGPQEDDQTLLLIRVLPASDS